MKTLALISVAFLGIKACTPDETLRAYGGADRTWQLIELNGEEYTAAATLTFPETGEIVGQAPCNGFSASLTVPYPWFGAENLISTRRTCPDQAAETAFLQALQTASLSEVAGDMMILSTDTGLMLVFTAAD